MLFGEKDVYIKALITNQNSSILLRKVIRKGENGYLQFTSKLNNDTCNTSGRKINLNIFFQVKAYNMLKLKTKSWMGNGHVKPSFYCWEQREITHQHLSLINDTDSFLHVTMQSFFFSFHLRFHWTSFIIMG